MIFIYDIVDYSLIYNSLLEYIFFKKEMNNYISNILNIL